MDLKKDEKVRLRICAPTLNDSIIIIKKTVFKYPRMFKTNADGRTHESTYH